MIQIRRLGAAVLVGALFLSGCSTNSSSPDTTATSVTESGESSLIPAAEGTTEYPLELPSSYGSTTLEARPERIATVTGSGDDTEALAAMGVTPVLASEFSMDNWLTAALKEEIPFTFSKGDEKYPAEQIAASNPDLIIAFGDIGAENHERLSKIAPVLTNEKAASEYTAATDWKQMVTKIGEVLDLSKAANAALEKEEQFYKSVAEKNPQLAGKTISYVVYYGEKGGLQYHSTLGSPVQKVFEKIGLKTAPAGEKLEYRQEISQENLDMIDADVIVFSDNSSGENKLITENPLWKKMPAVAEGRVIMIDNKSPSDASEQSTFTIDGKDFEGNLPWALARSGPLSGTWAVEQLLPFLSDRLS